MRGRASTQVIPRPVLKWVGGKGQLLGELERAVAASGWTGRYHEPFVGGGALFFHLYRQGKLGARKACLSDTNTRLVDVYHGIQENVEEVIALLEAHKAAHCKDHYYEVRAEVPDSVVARAARIIYLNKTCFNGLFRENSKGEFNVPMGRYKNPLICDAPNLRAVAEALKKAKVEQRSFDAVVGRAEPGDLVYFDPPYHPVSATASFTAYHAGAFAETDQRALAEVYAALDAKGVKVILSNSYTDLVLSLYARFKPRQVFASRNVNSRADRRGKVPEALVCNFPMR